MVVTLDDTYFYISYDDEEVKCLNRFEFDDCVKILLTQNQLNRFVCDETRDFGVGQKRIDKMLAYINDPKKNVWRRQEN